jgi:hypothetical protein
MSRELDADLGRPRAGEPGLRPDQGGFGAVPRGGRTLHRAPADRVVVGDVRLPMRGELVDRARVIERLLLVVATLLRVVERFLVDVAGELFTIDACLAVIQDASVGRSAGTRQLALVIVSELLVVDAGLISVAGQLLTIGDRLLEFGEALFLGQFLVADPLVRSMRHARLLAVGCQ